MNTWDGVKFYVNFVFLTAASDLFRHIKGLGTLGWLTGPMLSLSLTFMKRNIDGAQTTLYCVLDDQLENESGEYYSDCSKEKPHKATLDEKLVDWFYKESLNLIGKI